MRFLVCLLVVLLIFVSGCSVGLECIRDSDCVQDACCHASGCVSKEKAPDCEGVVCTMECAAGTMDCGQGHCACVDSGCKAVFE